MSSIDIVTQTIDKLKRLRDEIRKLSIDWWWLDQGDAPIVPVTSFIIENNKIISSNRLKTSIKIALNTLINNLEASLELTEKERTQLMKTVEEDLVNLTQIFQSVKEAHQIVSKLYDILNYLESKELTENTAKLKKIARGTIDWIREIFYTNIAEWPSKKNLFQNVVKKLQNDIGKSTQDSSTAQISTHRHLYFLRQAERNLKEKSLRNAVIDAWTAFEVFLKEKFSITDPLTIDTIRNLTSSHLSKNELDLLNWARNIRNKAVHEGYVPSQEEATKILDSIRILIQKLEKS